MKWAIRILLLVIIMTGVIIGHVVYRGELEIARCNLALEQGDGARAVVHARSAALWYAPGAPHVRFAYARLEALGRVAETQGNGPVALEAYRSIVSASYSTRSLWKPFEAEAARATERIIALEKSEGRSPEDPAGDGFAAALRAELAASPGPSFTWKVVLACAFLAMFFGIFRFGERGLDGAGHLQRKEAVASLGIAIAGFLAYLATLLFAS